MGSSIRCNWEEACHPRGVAWHPNFVDSVCMWSKFYIVRIKWADGGAGFFDESSYGYLCKGCFWVGERECLLVIIHRSNIFAKETVGWHIKNNGGRNGPPETGSHDTDTTPNGQCSNDLIASTSRILDNAVSCAFDIFPPLFLWDVMLTVFGSGTLRMHLQPNI